MATIGELLEQHVTRMVECLDRLCLDRYAATPVGPVVHHYDHLLWRHQHPEVVGMARLPACASATGPVGPAGDAGRRLTWGRSLHGGRDELVDLCPTRARRSRTSASSATTRCASATITVCAAGGNVTQSSAGTSGGPSGTCGLSTLNLTDQPCLGYTPPPT